MNGNVWQWTEACYNTSYKGAPTDGSAWTSGDCAKRVRRGGSWFDPPQTLRSAFRYGYVSSGRNDNGGFRLAKID
jgi:formylglycine-generating enzyme required for sulfatase activity